MAITGDLGTMPLVELLQWAGANRKTGVLELERNKLRRSITFRDGAIVGCSSDDPCALIGQFLISRGKITQRTLRYAMSRQEESGEPLTRILSEMGILGENDIEAQVSAKAEETIYGMFEWEDAIFRFQCGASFAPYTIEVRLSVEHVLLDGAQRQDEMARIRDVFHSSAIVLQRTGRAISPEIEHGRLLDRLLEMVDDSRTLAEIIVGAHASEYQVLRLLFELYRGGSIEIAEERPREGGACTLIDVREDEEPIRLPSLSELSVAEEVQSVIDDRLDGLDLGFSAKRPGADPGGNLPPETAEPAELGTLIHMATEKLESGDPEGALVIVDACYRARPEDSTVKELTQKAEGAYLDRVCRRLLAPDRIPVLEMTPAALASKSLQAVETSVLGLVDGQTNVQSMIWIAPLREIEVVRTLHNLFRRGMIRLEAPASAGQSAEPALAGDPVAT